MELKLAIVGGRTYNDYDAFKKIVDEYITELQSKPSLIISGGAKGVDTLAEIYAKDNNIPTEIFRPDWSKGKGAGLERNTDIIANSTHVLALPTKESRGTYDSIRKAKLYEKHLKVVPI